MILKRGDKIHLWATTKNADTLMVDKRFYEDMYSAHGVEIVGITFTHGQLLECPKIVAVFRD